MLSRRIRATISAVRFLSTESLGVEKAVFVSKSDATAQSSKSSSKGRDTLGKRLLSLVHPKRSAVVELRKWKEKGNVIRKYELNRIVRELRKMKRYKHALEICEWMRIQEDIQLLPGDYAVHLDLIAKLRNPTSAEKFFIDLPEKMKGPQTCTALLHTYVKMKDTDKAEALMEKMLDCGLVKCALPYNHMISLYTENGNPEKVKDVFKEMKKKTTPDLVSYNLWLTVCSSLNDLASAEKAFLEMKTAKLEPDWLTYSILSSLYTKNGRKVEATSTLKEMEKRASRKNRAAYSSLISLLTTVGDKAGVHGVWKKMKSLFRKLSDVEYICMISSLVKFDDIKEAEELYSEWRSVSPTGDTRVPNLLLAAYINRDKMGTAKRFYEEMIQKGIKPSYTTWELLAWGYLKQRQMDQVLACFEKALGCVKKWEPDMKLVKEIYKGLEEQANIEAAEKLLVILRKAEYVTTQIYNMLLRTYAKAGRGALVIAERMENDKVELNEETIELIKQTSKMCISDTPSTLS